MLSNPAVHGTTHRKEVLSIASHIWLRVRGLKSLPVIAGMVVLLVLAVLAAGCGSSGESSTTGSQTSGGASSSTTAVSPDTTVATTGPIVPTTGGPKVPKLTLVAPPGPMAIPMAYMKVNGSLAAVADETELIIWQNADQLKAIVAGEQGDFITAPSNTSAIFYNKGLTVVLLDISVWNITYLVTRDEKATGFADIKGESLVVSLKGSVPDVMFQYIVKKAGLDPQKDFELRYATDPTQAAQLLLAGQVDNAVLSEALATSAILQSKNDERPLRRALAFDAAWEQAAGASKGTPIAGTVAAPSMMDRPDIVAAFMREYEAAVQWMLANPEEAGKLVETELPELGLKAAPLTASLKSINWKFTPAQDARASLEAFYTALMDLSPEVIGGKLPDDGFYYAP